MSVPLVVSFRFSGREYGSDPADYRTPTWRRCPVCRSILPRRNAAARRIMSER